MKENIEGKKHEYNILEMIEKILKTKFVNNKSKHHITYMHSKGNKYKDRKLNTDESN